MGFSSFVRSLVMVALFSVYVSAQETTVSYDVDEESGSQIFIGNIARDSQLYGNVSIEEFQRMTFQILVQGNEHASKFTIDETRSTLKTASNLDREELCDTMNECVLSFNVAVYLKDKDTEGLDLHKIIRVRVNVRDINDNRPTFPNKEVTISIAENSPVDTGYFTDGATDHDVGNNSIQHYVLEPANGMFGLKVLPNQDGTSDLNIVVKFPLDRETTSSYRLTVYAIDGGKTPQNGSVNINIEITDQNDNTPIFSKPEYNESVEENIPINSTIVHVIATDSDAGDNGLIRYRFSSRTPSKVLDTFAINENTGVITSKTKLNYEENQAYSFYIEAYDGGSPSKKASVKVNVNIININDNYPQININLPPGGTQISEAAHVGSFIAHVAVFDDDGEDQKITCTINGDDFKLEDFKITNNYKVVVNKELDHERQSEYDVKIVCNDSGTPPKSNETSFVVKVEDVNDNYPLFRKSRYELTIQEEVFQSMILQVEAVDYDSGANGQVTYGLAKGSDGRFAINSRTGLITANSVFDREVDPEIRLQVLAYDSGNKSLTSTATVFINVTDINDNAPKFPSNPLNLKIMESEAMQTVNLNVTDPDFGPNGQFTLTFPDNDYLAEYFEFNSVTGEIKTLQAIDREKIPYFKFMVKAVDHGTPQMSSSAEVIVHIVDRNDNIPAISYPNNANNTKVIPVNAYVGYVVATVNATDKDDGLNSQLLFFIDSGDTREIFRMDVNSGRVTVGREMTPQDADSYKLEIAVRDNGDPQRTAMATLNVIVKPENMTSLAAAAEETKQNTMLVVVIVGVTIIISAAIIVSIFILRYIDKRNRSRMPPPKSKQQPNEGRFYDIARADESLSGSSNMSKDSDTELLKKRAKKEVSFSIDESCSDMGNNSSLTNVTSFSTMKPSYLSMDYKTPEDTQTWIGTNSMLSDLSKTDLYTEKELSALTHSQLQSAIHRIAGGNSDKLWLQPVREEQKKHIPRKADDNHSETSHDTTTSDSGRGGSEEDIHSNRGHPISDSEESRQYIYRCSNRPKDKLMPRRPPPPIPVDSYPRNISFSDDSVTANTTVASKLQALSPKSPTFYQTPKRHHEVFTISGRSKDTMLESQMTTPGLGYSVGDIDTISEMATVRDDASTTTSGSYTINPDELCNEIDDLFFKDVIV